MSPSNRASLPHLSVLRQGLVFLCASLLPLVGFLVLAWHCAFVRLAITTVEPYLAMALQVLAVTGMVWTVVARRAGWRPAPAWTEAATRNRAVWYGLLLGACAILFVCPLISVWTDPGPSMYLIGGMLPFSDGMDYYRGALLQLFSGKLDVWNSRRPINALLYAVRLAWVGDDFRLAIVLQAVLLGVSAYLFAVTVARDYGRPGGLLVFAMAFAFGRPVVVSPLSEALGLTLGLLASTLLWRGARDRRLGIFTPGVFVLTVALSARPGALLALPALILWAGVAFRNPGRRLNWRACCLAVGAVVIGASVQVLLKAIYGGGAGLGQGNFWLTFYGLTKGYPDWTQIYRDYPRTRGMADPALNSFARARAFELLRQNPFGLVAGVARGFWLWLRYLPILVVRLLGVGLRPAMPAAVRYGVASVATVVAGGALWCERSRMNPIVTVSLVVGAGMLLAGLGVVSFVNDLAMWFLITGGLWALWQARREPATWLILLHGAALMVSAAIVFRDAGFRALIVSYPLFLLPAAMAASGWMTHAPEPPDLDDPGGLWPACAALGIALVLVAAALVGPKAAHWREPARLVPAAPKGAGTDSLVVRLGPGVAYLKILAPGSSTPTFTPVIRDEDWAKVSREVNQHYWGISREHRFRGPLTVALLCNLRRGDTAMYFVVGPAGLIGRKWETVELFGKRVQGREFTYVFVERSRPWQGESRP